MVIVFEEFVKELLGLLEVKEVFDNVVTSATQSFVDSERKTEEEEETLLLFNY